MDQSRFPRMRKMGSVVVLHLRLHIVEVELVLVESGAEMAIDEVRFEVLAFLSSTIYDERNVATVHLRAK